MQGIFFTIAVQCLLCAGCFAATFPVLHSPSLEQNMQKTNCTLTSLQQSTAMIALILQDPPPSYNQPGSSIATIKQSYTHVFLVFIAQEERIDQLTYRMSVDEACTAKILSWEP